MKEKTDYSYYSKKLGKCFDTLNDLLDAEKADEEEKEKKEKAVAERKTDAVKVEDAYRALTDAVKVKGEKIRVAQKDYLKKQAELTKEYENQLSAINKEVEAASDVYNGALKEFQEKHGDFHTTIKDGDSTISITANKLPGSIFGTFWDDFFDSIFKF